MGCYGHLEVPTRVLALRLGGMEGQKQQNRLESMFITWIDIDDKFNVEGQG